MRRRGHFEIACEKQAPAAEIQDPESFTDKVEELDAKDRKLNDEVNQEIMAS